MANSTLKDMNTPEALDQTLVEFPDNRLLIELCGQFDRNLAAFEQGFGVVIMRRGNQLALHGPDDQRERAVSGLRLGGKFRRSVGVTQGCRPIGEPLFITRCDGSQLLEIDGQRPLDVLKSLYERFELRV